MDTEDKNISANCTTEVCFEHNGTNQSWICFWREYLFLVVYESFRGQLHSKFSGGGVYRRIYGQNFVL